MIIQDAIYCAWDCKNSINAIIILINILVTFSLFIFGLTIFKKSKKILNEGMSKFYYLILGWALSKIIIRKHLFLKMLIVSLSFLVRTSIT